MQTASFETILCSLPSLSAAQLLAVKALVLELSAQKSSGAFGPPPAASSSNRRKKKTKKGKPGQKGPAKPAPNAEYSSLEEYKEFKRSEKVLRDFLKKENKSLSAFKEELPQGTPPHPAPVATFYENRKLWFRRKAQLKAEPSGVSSSSSSSGAPAKEEKEGKAN